MEKPIVLSTGGNLIRKVEPMPCVRSCEAAVCRDLTLCYHFDFRRRAGANRPRRFILRSTLTIGGALAVRAGRAAATTKGTSIGEIFTAPPPTARASATTNDTHTASCDGGKYPWGVRSPGSHHRPVEIPPTIVTCRGSPRAGQLQTERSGTGDWGCAVRARPRSAPNARGRRTQTGVRA